MELRKNTSYLLAQKKVDIILVEAHLFSDKPTTFGEIVRHKVALKNRGLQKLTMMLIFKKSESQNKLTKKFK